MSTVRAKFRLEDTERTALFKATSKRGYDQIGWGTKVRMKQIREDAMTVPLVLVVNDIEAKMFLDAPANAEFEITVSPLAKGQNT